MAEPDLVSHQDSSYPPLLHQLEHTATASVPAVNPDLNQTLEIPLLDLHHLDPSDLGEACRELGIFRLVNHGVPPSLSADLHHEAKRLLSLPFEAKKALLRPPEAYLWGSPVVTQNVRNLNWVEGFHLPLPHLDPPCGDGDGERLDTGSHDSAVCFRALAREYRNHMTRISKKVFEAITLDLEMQHGRSSLLFSTLDELLRVYRYPCCPDPNRYFGMDAHTDSSLLSILSQGDVGGFQVLKDQKWFDVRPISGSLVVNLGDIMKAISDDKYESVEHRVLASWRRERMSLCYFNYPQEDKVISSSKYKPFTYSAFREKVQEDVRTTGFKVGLQQFRM